MLARDVDGFDRFYEAEFAEQVRRATLLLGSTESAHDVVQDSFAKLYPRWGQIESPGGYLNRSVLNACRDLGRQRSLHRRVAHRLEDRSVVGEQPDHLGDVLLSLPFNQRAAVVLRFYAAMTTNEIADHLGCPPGSVGPWINRALKQLRKALACPTSRTK